MPTRYFNYNIPYLKQVREHTVFYQYDAHNLNGTLYIDNVLYNNTDVMHLINDDLYVKIWDAAIDDVIGYLDDINTTYIVEPLSNNIYS